jgi:amino acid transporter
LVSSTADTARERSLGYWAVVSIGIGGMVGGGIFAVLGLAVELARGGTPIAFALAGGIAFLTAYSYARLSIAFPSQGGTVEFINQAFGPGLFSGSANILLWLSYAVMISLYAYAFGSYGASFFPPDRQPLIKHALITGVIILLAVLNALRTSLIGRFEEWTVGFKLTILLLFIGTGVWSLKIGQLGPKTWASTPSLLAGGMIIFLAYEGFELIANTAGDVRNPRKTLPRGYYSAVGFVALLYILISMVTVGHLSLSKIVAAKDYALAESARPFLGTSGFVLVAIAALLSTASAINATFYGASRVSFIIAKEGELPALLEKKIWDRPLEGLLITTALTLVAANLFDISSISTIGSAGFLLIFAAVNASNARLAQKTESSRAVSLLGLAACVLAFLALILKRSKEAPGDLWILGTLVGASFLIEGVYRRLSGKPLRYLIKDAGP